MAIVVGDQGRDRSGQPGGGVALQRIRGYTTWSLVAIVVGYSLLGAVDADEPQLVVAILVAGVLVAFLVRWWERPPPLTLAISALTVSFAQWCLAVVLGEGDFSAMSLAVSCAVVVHHFTRGMLLGLALALIVLIAPPVLSASSGGGAAGRSISVALIWFAAALAALWLNGYAWRLAVELAAAGRDAEELAVMRERVRFAADLHDLHGHTLHLVRLKIALANRLLNSDLTLVEDSLRQAERLIDDALASTRQLAFGEQPVRLETELANAHSLFTAAGIDMEVDRSADLDPQADELFGRLIREATTNVFRHAQAGRVSIRIGPNTIGIANDGAPPEAGQPRGLAVLRDRFRQSGGDLDIDVDHGSFHLLGRVK